MNRTRLAFGFTVVVAILVLLSGSAVWATNDQAPLAQTVPPPETPTPTPTPPPPPPPPWPWPWPPYYPGFNPSWYPPGWGMPTYGGLGCYPCAPRPVVQYAYSWGYSWSNYYTWQPMRPYWPSYPVGPVW